MTSARFTSGPWRVGADLTGICVDWRDENGNSSSECFARNGWAKTVAKITHASFAGIDEHVANARLIAAAPDLYDACYAAYQQIDGEKYPDLIGPLHAALFKARGEQ
jgi:hypothetical protein